MPKAADLQKLLQEAILPLGRLLAYLEELEDSEVPMPAPARVARPRIYQANNGAEADDILLPRINLIRQVVARDPETLLEEMEENGEQYQMTCQLDNEGLGEAAKLDKQQGGTTYRDAWIEEVDLAIATVLEHCPNTLVSVYVGQGAMSENLRPFVFQAIRRATAVSAAPQKLSLGEMKDFRADLDHAGLGHLPVFVSTIFCSKPLTPPPGDPKQFVYNGQPKPGAWEPLSLFIEDMENAIAVFDRPSFVVRGVGVSAILLAETLRGRIGA